MGLPSPFALILKFNAPNTSYHIRFRYFKVPMSWHCHGFAVYLANFRVNAVVLRLFAHQSGGIVKLEKLLCAR